MSMKNLGRAYALAGVVASLALTGCGEDEPKPPEPQPLVCDAQAYTNGVHDAAEPTQDDVVNGLWAIAPSNTKLVWNETKTAVRMVIWTDYTGYKPGDMSLTREVWMTAAPQLQEICRTVAADNVSERMNQVLGLPPFTAQSNPRFFVEAWVKPSDMFRPCPDSEIDDTTCGLTFPPSATAEHKNWINANYANSYGFWLKTQYPWTGLGYTYDWCNASTHVGASEFVVRSGSQITVSGVFDKADYCKP
ncbi:hypothetical protein JGU66_15645 [Myxococcaceae bacterium JPH2]|nr:hypothetical protein [Myxococcaceae bacterium JPH2]